MTVFARSLDDNLASLVKKLDNVVKLNSEKDMAGFVVLLTDDPDATEEKLVAFAKEHGIENLPLTLFDGIAGPPSYKIAEDAEVTVMMWRNQRVRAARAFAKSGLDEEGISAVVSETELILD